MALTEPRDRDLPAPVKHPHCAKCAVPMWQLHADARTSRPERLYECKVCGERAVIAADSDQS